MKAIQFTGYGEISKNIMTSEIEKPTIDKDEVQLKFMLPA